jgi:hypothetical protein
VAIQPRPGLPLPPGASSGPGPVSEVRIIDAMSFGPAGERRASARPRVQRCDHVTGPPARAAARSLSNESSEHSDRAPGDSFSVASTATTPAPCPPVAPAAALTGGAAPSPGSGPAPADGSAPPAEGRRRFFKLDAAGKAKLNAALAAAAGK